MNKEQKNCFEIESAFILLKFNFVEKKLLNKVHCLGYLTAVASKVPPQYFYQKRVLYHADSCESCNKVVCFKYKKIELSG
jgi:hypothetical protein